MHLLVFPVVVRPILCPCNVLSVPFKPTNPSKFEEYAIEVARQGSRCVCPSATASVFASELSSVNVAGGGDKERNNVDLRSGYYGYVYYEPLNFAATCRSSTQALIPRSPAQNDASHGRMGKLSSLTKYEKYYDRLSPGRYHISIIALEKNKTKNLPNHNFLDATMNLILVCSSSKPHIPNLIYASSMVFGIVGLFVHLICSSAGHTEGS